MISMYYLLLLFLLLCVLNTILKHLIHYKLENKFLYLYFDSSEIKTHILCLFINSILWCFLFHCTFYYPLCFVLIYSPDTGSILCIPDTLLYESCISITLFLLLLLKRIHIEHTSYSIQTSTWLHPFGEWVLYTHAAI